VVPRYGDGRQNYLVALKTALAWPRAEAAGAVPEFPRIKVPKKKPQPIPAESFERMLQRTHGLIRRKSLCNGEDGIRTRGGVLSPHRFSKPLCPVLKPF